MPIEKQVVSLDLAKRLKELGVKQESLFCFEERVVAGKIEPEYDFVISPTYILPSVWRKHQVAAFTVAELGEMLPSFVKTERDGYVNLRNRKTDNGLYLCSGYSGDELVIEFGDGTNEANSRAKMLIYLIENKLITV